jgi:hypothetical protein
LPSSSLPQFIDSRRDEATFESHRSSLAVLVIVIFSIPSHFPLQDSADAGPEKWMNTHHDESLMTKQRVLSARSEGAESFGIAFECRRCSTLVERSVGTPDTLLRNGNVAEESCSVFS